MDVVLDPEQYATGIHELDVDILQHSTAEPGVAGQIHRLLRCACAFDRHRRLGEQRPAFLQVLDKLPGIRCQVIAIIRGHAVAAELLGETVGAVTGAGEHDGAPGGSDDVGGVLHPIVVFDQPEVMAGIDSFGLGGAGVVTDRVVLVLPAQRGDVARRGVVVFVREAGGVDVMGVVQPQGLGLANFFSTVSWFDATPSGPVSPALAISKAG